VFRFCVNFVIYSSAGKYVTIVRVLCIVGCLHFPVPPRVSGRLVTDVCRAVSCDLHVNDLMAHDQQKRYLITPTSVRDGLLSHFVSHHLLDEIGIWNTDPRQNLAI
jgi:hypothetical protein